MLKRILVVMGRYILKFPRSITRSPGSFPGSGIFGKKWISKPAASNIAPAIIKNFPIFKITKRPTNAWLTKGICF